jgi:hypothetical protein
MQSQYSKECGDRVLAVVLVPENVSYASRPSKACCRNLCWCKALCYIGHQVLPAHVYQGWGILCSARRGSEGSINQSHCASWRRQWLKCLVTIVLSRPPCPHCFQVQREDLIKLDNLRPCRHLETWRISYAEFMNASALVTNVMCLTMQARGSNSRSAFVMQTDQWASCKHVFSNDAAGTNC